MQSQNFNENVNSNVEETFFNFYINDMAAFDRIKLLHLRKLLTLHSLEVSSSPNSPLLFAIAFFA